MSNAKLQITFSTAKNDIVDSWENPIRENSRITRDWIFSVDPETMTFVEALWNVMPNSYSLYDVFCKIMKSKDLNSILVNC